MAIPSGTSMKGIKHGLFDATKLATTYGPAVTGKVKGLYESMMGGTGGKTINWTKGNRTITACGVVGGAGALLVAVPAVVSSPLLAIAGFTASGVKSASIAATVQSGIGNVAAGTYFAILQSAGAGGSALGLVNGFIQASGAAVGLISGGVAYFKSR